MELIKDKVVIVTGAAAGIGAGVAQAICDGRSPCISRRSGRGWGQEASRRSAIRRRLGVWL